MGCVARYKFINTERSSCSYLSPRNCGLVFSLADTAVILKHKTMRKVQGVAYSDLFEVLENDH